MRNKLETYSTMIFASIGYLLFCSSLPSFLAMIFQQVIPWSANGYYGVFSLVAGIFYVRLLYQKWGERMEITKNITGKGILEALGVGLFLFLFLNFLVSPFLGLIFPASNENYYDSVRQMYETPVATFIQVTFIAPLFEELVFRGFLLKRELKRQRKWKGIFIVAFFFGLLHMSLVQGCSAFVAGLILCYFYTRNEAVGLTILTHSIYNGLAYVLVTFR